MKKKTFIVLMIMAVVAAMCFTACGKKAPETLESYIDSHPEVKEEIDEKLGTDELKGVTIEFSGNEMTYTYDISGMDNITEEIAKSDTLKESLDAGLEQQSSTFVQLANTLKNSVKEDGVELETVKVTVIYTYEDTQITSRTFEADDSAAAAGDAEAEDEAEDAAEDAAEEAVEGDD